jgi:serine/threonine-protein kinase
LALSTTPAQIGRYRIESVLGRGAMGVIYRAHDPEIDRPVAIKLIRADLLDGGERADYLQRFRREAQAAGRCTHPNIVAVYDFATHEGNPFLAMEFIDGISLAQAPERGLRFGVADSIALIAQVLAALAAAHAMGVVHRDIKPANILLASSSHVKVTDFGISRVGGASLTQAGAMVGTPSYMSPEQCRGEAVDGRSDLFSAGIVLYELLAGQRPFPGRSFEEVWHKLMHADPPDLAAINPAIGAVLAGAVARSLAKSPDDRFPTAAAMAEALGRAAAEPGAVPDEGTIIRPIQAAPAPAFTPTFDAAIVALIERRLTEVVGPIAHVLMQSAVGRAGSVAALCSSLAGSIEPGQERDRFLADINRQLGLATQPAAPPAPQLALAEAEKTRLQTELARVLGPVAGALIQRERGRATSTADLWERLSHRIDNPAERRAFLSKKPP